MRISPIWLGALLVVGWSGAAGSLGAQDTDSRKQEEAEDYFGKWLNQDVKYIITDEEKEVFKKLQTVEEKERFIEEFWRRRDPDPRTAANEFKEEHYRRIAYANDHFASGFAGWKTDRGRVYIIYGKPDSIDATPSGGAYQRPDYEGGGATATYPFEVWRYRHIEGLGDDIELEFVDKSWTGDYQLALSADEKDVFLQIEGHGETKAEQIGLATRTQRLNQPAAFRELYPVMRHRMKDSPFQRYETFARVKAAPIVKFKDLQENVRVNLSYDQLPFQFRPAYFKLNENQVLAPLTVEFPNQSLTYVEENGRQTAKIGLYAIVTSISNRVVYEFEEEIVSSYTPEQFQSGRTGRTIYQRNVLLEQNLRYKIDLVVKDLKSGNIGTLQKGLVSPSFPDDDLSSSSMVLADYIEQLATVPPDEQMFVMGDIKVRPAVEKMFPANGVLGLYVQLYGAGFDQATDAPSLEVTFSLWKQGKRVFEEVDPDGKSAFFYSDQRVVLIKGVPLTGIGSGDCQVQVQIKDRIRNETLTLEDKFQILPAVDVGD